MIQNSILFVALLLICFGIVLISKKWLGKAGLFAWIAIASIASNITAAAIGPMCGLKDVTLANVPFATVFLSCQILTMEYGVKEGKKGVYIGLFSSITFLIIMTTSSYLIQSEYDTVSESIQKLFNLNSFGVCNTVASVLMFFLANLLDVILFNILNKKLQGKKLWISNNVAGIFSNCLENFAFVLLGLYLFPLIIKLEPYAIKDCLMIALTTCIFEVVIGLLDTPVLYLAKKTKNGDEIYEH